MADRARRQSEQKRQSRNAARRRANARVRKQVDARKRSSGRARKPGAKRGGGMVPDRSRGGGPAMGKAKKVGTKSAINSSKPKNVSKRQVAGTYSDPRAYRSMGTRGGYAQGRVTSGRLNNRANRKGRSR